METSLNWNISLFHALNASSQPAPFVLGITRFIAQDTPYLVLGGLLLIWFLGGPGRRRSLMFSGASLALALAVNFAIAAALYVPRPAEAGIGHTFLEHSVETSFPSDHATFLWSLGFALVFAPPLRWAGLLISLFGLATAWSRVFLGVHFPLDMAGSLLISFASALITLKVRRWLDRIIFSPAEHLYLGLLSNILRRPTN